MKALSFLFLSWMAASSLFGELSETTLSEFFKEYHLSEDKRQKGYSELAYALMHDQPEVAEILIAKGADVNQTFHENTSSPMSLAIEKGYVSLVQKMIDHKADVNLVIEGIYDECMPKAVDESSPEKKCGPDRYSLLQIAIRAKQPEIAALLIDRGADPHFLTKLHYRPIHLAIRHQQFDTLERLLKKEVDVNAVDVWGYAPLHYVAFLPAEADPESYATALLEKRADPNQKIDAPFGKFAPLHIAAFNGHRALTRKLLSFSASPDLEDGQGCTPLWCAINSGRASPEVVEELLIGGANPNWINRYGMVGPPPNLYFYTPLTLAIAKNQLDTAKVLLEHRADPNEIDGNGETPLLAAVAFRRPGAISLLLEYGANPSTKNRLGVSPIDRAVDKKQPILLDLLIEGQVNLLSR